MADRSDGGSGSGTHGGLDYWREEEPVAWEIRIAARFFHFATDIAGKRMIADYDPDPVRGMDLYLADLADPMADRRGNGRGCWIPGRTSSRGAGIRIRFCRRMEPRGFSIRMSRGSCRRTWLEGSNILLKETRDDRDSGRFV